MTTVQVTIEKKEVDLVDEAAELVKERVPMREIEQQLVEAEPVKDGVPVKDIQQESVEVFIKFMPDLGF